MFMPTENGCAATMLHRLKGMLGMVLFSFLLASSSADSLAQLLKPKSPAATPEPATLDPLRRETPRGAVEGALRCSEREDFACVARYLQAPPGQQMDMVEVARELH